MHVMYSGCISMQRYWSSLRYSFLRTLILLAADYVVIQRPPARFPVSSVCVWCGLSRAGFLSFPAPFSLRVSISLSTGILGIPLPVLLSNTSVRRSSGSRISSSSSTCTCTSTSTSCGGGGGGGSCSRVVAAAEGVLVLVILVISSSSGGGGGGGGGSRNSSSRSSYSNKQ